ncbi:MAG: AMP-binding protein, partial [Candidatus Binatia bacterium]
MGTRLTAAIALPHTGVLSALGPTHPAPLGDAYRRAGLWRGETLWRALETSAARGGDDVAVVDGATRVTFAELRERSARVANGLAALGTRAGDAVSVQLPNWHETVIAYLAIARLGAVMTPILPAYRERELAFILNQVGARVLLAPGRHRDCDHRALARALRPLVPTLEHVVTVRDEPGPGMHAWTTLESAPDTPAPIGGDAEAVVLVLYTSGTTADPKGVLHSHETLLAEARSLGPVHGIRAGDTTLMPSPLAHISGIVHAVLVPCVFGARAVLMDRWDATAALELIATERVTYMVGAPTFLRDLA